MSKKVVTRYFCFAAAVAVMVFIFVMSAKNSTESSDISHSFTRKVLELFLKSFGTMTSARQEEIILGLQFFVRKSAHAFIYTVLGALFAGGFLTIDKIKKAKRFFVPFLCSALYAASDEIHQLFVLGRSCELRDVIIDSTGAAIGIILVLLIFFAHLKRKSKKNTVVL